MYSVTKSFGLNGLRGFAVAVEADVSGGLPAFSIVGLPDSAVRESADSDLKKFRRLFFVSARVKCDLYRFFGSV